VAVLIEDIAVVVRCKSIIESYVGGQAAFTKGVPNNTSCADGWLAAVMFMTPADAKAYVQPPEASVLQRADGSLTGYGREYQYL
jgi:hypothetical protein